MSISHKSDPLIIKLCKGVRARNVNFIRKFGIKRLEYLVKSVYEIVMASSDVSTSLLGIYVVASDCGK